MWSDDGRGPRPGGDSGGMAEFGQTRRPGQLPRNPHGFHEPRRPEPPDALETPPGADASPLGEALPAHGSRVATPAWYRQHARQLIREFLRAVPRSEPEATLVFLRPDGAPRMVTRAQLTEAIDRLRPRMRQIVRLGIEERWPRQRVCDYLQHISLKTFERDFTEALDILMEL